MKIRIICREYIIANQCDLVMNLYSVIPVVFLDAPLG